MRSTAAQISGKILCYQTDSRSDELQLFWRSEAQIAKTPLESGAVHSGRSWRNSVSGKPEIPQNLAASQVKTLGFR